MKRKRKRMRNKKPERKNFQRKGGEKRKDRVSGPLHL